jgi:hypothetical protein
MYTLRLSLWRQSSAVLAGIWSRLSKKSVWRGEDSRTISSSSASVIWSRCSIWRSFFKAWIGERHSGLVSLLELRLGWLLCAREQLSLWRLNRLGRRFLLWPDGFLARFRLGESDGWHPAGSLEAAQEPMLSLDFLWVFKGKSDGLLTCF